MFDWISIPIWSKAGGGASAVNEPGKYKFYVLIPLPSSLIGWSAKIPATSWQVTVTDIGSWSGGSIVYADVGPQVGVNEAALSPLQIDALLGIGLVAAFALLVDRVEKISPMITIAVYGVILIVLIVVYVKWIHPMWKG